MVADVLPPEPENVATEAPVGPDRELPGDLLNDLPNAAGQIRGEIDTSLRIGGLAELAFGRSAAGKRAYRVASVTQGGRGKVTPYGQYAVTYEPQPGFVGTDAFEVVVEDDRGATATTAITVVVGEAEAEVAPRLPGDVLVAWQKGKMPPPAAEAIPILVAVAWFTYARVFWTWGSSVIQEDEVLYFARSQWLAHTAQKPPPNGDALVLPPWLREVTAIDVLTDAFVGGIARCSGEDVASGRRVDIAPKEWHDLLLPLPEQRTNSIFRVGGGVRYRRGRIETAGLADLLDGATGLYPDRTGAPGRPSSMNTVLNEHKRRRQKGRTAKTRAYEAKELYDWFLCDHPERPAPKVRSIQNKLPPNFQPFVSPEVV